MPYPINIKTALILAGPYGRDPRLKRTLHFFAWKGFLMNSPPSQRLRKRLCLQDVLWTCAVAAPDLYEILPVACLRFPEHLPGTPPDDLAAVIAKVKIGAQTGPDYQGHPYWRVRQWADLELTDGRVTPKLTSRIQFRLPIDVIGEIHRLAKTTGRTRTEVVTKALKHFFETGELRPARARIPKPRRRVPGL